MIGVNLLPLERQQARSARRRAGRWALAVGAYAAVLVPAAIVLSPSVGEAARLTNEQIKAAAERIERAENGLRELRPQLMRTRRQVEATRAVCEHADWSILLALYAAHRNGEIGIESCEITTPRSEPAAQAPNAKPAKTEKPQADPGVQVALTGFGITPGAVTTFALRLEESGVFSSVRIAETTPRDVHGVSATWFRLRCTLQPPAAGPGATAKGKP